MVLTEVEGQRLSSKGSGVHCRVTEASGGSRGCGLGVLPGEVSGKLSAQRKQKLPPRREGGPSAPQIHPFFPLLWRPWPFPEPPGL